MILDFDHLVLAPLAKFHGLSYIAKHVDRVKFTELVTKVEDTHWNAGGKWYISEKGLEGLLSNGLDTLVESKSGYDKQAQRFRTKWLAEPIKNLKRVLEPVEPFSVLCHSDFGRHNLLFRYDNGRPLDALAFDMALIHYGSPALDLSYFVYLNTDQKTRDDHWNKLLNVYCETLASVAGNALVPDRTQLDAEMRKHGFYGLALTSLTSRFLINDQKNFDSTKLFGMTDDEELQFWLLHGGKERLIGWQTSFNIIWT